MSFKSFGVIDAKRGHNSEKVMMIIIAEEFGVCSIHAYPLRDGEFKVDSYHLFTENLECSMNEAIAYIKEIFPNVFEINDPNDILEKIKKIE